MPRTKPIDIGRVGRRRVHLTPEERSTHLHVVGASGRGKSKFLEWMIRQDILNRHGVCLLDPHGTLYDALVAWCAHYDIHKERRIHLLNPSLPDWRVGFNPLRVDDAYQADARVDAMIRACAQVWGGEDHNSTPLLKKCLRAVFYALAVHRLTLAEALVLTSSVDADHLRRYLTTKLDNPVMQAVWDEFNGLRQREFVEQFTSTNNRLVEFLAAPAVREIVGLREPALDLARCMAEGDIVLVNLAPTPSLSADNARLIGTMLLNDLFFTARGRDARRAAERPFYLYVDECYHFLTQDVVDMLDQTRKFGLHVTLAHQRLGQLGAPGTKMYDGVMAGAQTKVVFGLADDDDARRMARQIFRTEFDLERPKESMMRPTVVGHVPIWLRSESAAMSETEGDSVSETEVSSVGLAAAVGTLYDEHGDVGGHWKTIDRSSGTATGVSRGTFSTRGTAHSEGRHEALMPVLEDRPQELFTLEELTHEAQVRLLMLPKRRAILKVPTERSVELRAMTVRETPASGRTIERFVCSALERDSASACTRSAAVAQMEERRARFVEDARRWQSQAGAERGETECE